MSERTIELREFGPALRRLTSAQLPEVAKGFVTGVVLFVRDEASATAPRDKGLFARSGAIGVGSSPTSSLPALGGGGETALRTYKYGERVHLVNAAQLPGIPKRQRRRPSRTGRRRARGRTPRGVRVPYSPFVERRSHTYEAAVTKLTSMAGRIFADAVRHGFRRG